MQEALVLAILPLLIASVLHMLLVKKKLFKFLEIPISKKLFGENKTWRGFIFLTLSTAVFCSLFGWLFSVQNAMLNPVLGAILGFTYMIFELPNSMFKRWMGIAPGQSPVEGRIYFSILDKTDSALGVALVYSMLNKLSFTDGFLLFITCSGIHMLMSFLLVALRIKKSF